MKSEYEKILDAAAESIETAATKEATDHAKRFAAYLGVPDVDKKYEEFLEYGEPRASY